MGVGKISLPGQGERGRGNGGGDVYSEIYSLRGELLRGQVFCSNVSELQIFRRLGEEANGSRDLTIVARHSPSRHETRVREHA